MTGAETADREAVPGGCVAEIAGQDGAFSFPERLLQQIWHRGDFDLRSLRLRDGRPLRLLRRGRWNRLAGPDFADAEIEIGEGAARELRRGAVEVHLRAGDWDQHGHASDPAYAGVILHVVLFPSMREWTAGAQGRRIPILELLPLLERDLEAYAEEAAVEGMAGRSYSQLREAFASVPPETLRVETGRHASRRWEAKVRLAGQRIEWLGWEEACHHSALEVFGYRPNRAPMLKVAEAFPLERWRESAKAGLDERACWLDQVWHSVDGEWTLSGVRPANQPRRRLEQYARWVAARPFWPEALAAAERDLTHKLSDPVAEVRPPGEPGKARRTWQIGIRRQELAERVSGGEIGGSRLDTMICDAWLPLLAARAESGGVGHRTRDVLGRLWSAWIPGDTPAELPRLAREFRVAGESGDVLGQGHLQGLLGWLAALAPRDGRGA